MIKYAVFTILISLLISLNLHTCYASDADPDSLKRSAEHLTGAPKKAKTAPPLSFDLPTRIETKRTIIVKMGAIEGKALNARIWNDSQKTKALAAGFIFSTTAFFSRELLESERFQQISSLPSPVGQWNIFLKKNPEGAPEKELKYTFIGVYKIQMPMFHRTDIRKSKDGEYSSEEHSRIVNRERKAHKSIYNNLDATGHSAETSFFILQGFRNQGLMSEVFPRLNALLLKPILEGTTHAPRFVPLNNTYTSRPLKAGELDIINTVPYWNAPSIKLHLNNGWQYRAFSSFVVVHYTGLSDTSSKIQAEIIRYANALYRLEAKTISTEEQGLELVCNLRESVNAITALAKPVNRKLFLRWAIDYFKTSLVKRLKTILDSSRASPPTPSSLGADYMLWSGEGPIEDSLWPKIETTISRTVDDIEKALMALSSKSP